MNVILNLKYFILFAVFGLPYVVSGQNNELLLLNSKKILISEYSIDTTDLESSKIFFTNFNGKQRSKYLDDVFSVVGKNGSEVVFYTPDEETGDLFTREQMKHYLMGQQVAIKNYSEPWSMLLGGITGFSGVMVPGISVDNDNFNGEIPIGLVIPAAYIVGVGSITPDNLLVKGEIESKYANNEYYIMGCQEGIRKKRLKNSAIGVGIGIVAGFVTLAVVN